jgi:hypothetical protein
MQACPVSRPKLENTRKKDKMEIEWEDLDEAMRNVEELKREHEAAGGEWYGVMRTDWYEWNLKQEYYRKVRWLLLLALCMSLAVLTLRWLRA